MKNNSPAPAKLTISRETVTTYRQRTGVQAGTLMTPPPVRAGFTDLCNVKK